MNKIRCNQCYWVGNEDQLVIKNDTEHCPHCDDSECLMDIDIDFVIANQKAAIKVHKRALRTTTTLGSKIIMEQELDSMYKRLKELENVRKS